MQKSHPYGIEPTTALKRYRQLVHRKWTQDNKGHAGRPKISQDTEKLVLHLAQGNKRWGYGKIEGELKKLGIKITLTSMRNILNGHGIVPAPGRYGSIGRHPFLVQQQLKPGKSNGARC